jgi:hypothetical protein
MANNDQFSWHSQALAARIIAQDMGRASVHADGITVEAAWYRQTDTDWGVCLAVDTGTRKVESDREDVITLSGDQPERQLADRLALRLAELIAAA